MKRIFALMLALLMLTGLAACKDTDKTPGDKPGGDAEYDIEREEGCNKLTFYWNNPSGDYSACDMWIWYPNKDGRGYLFHPCGYGAKVVLNVPQDITEVGFIVRKNCSDPGGTSWGDAVKDYEDDRFALITGEETVVYLVSGDGAQYMSDDGGKTLYQAKKFNMAGIVAMDKIKYNITPAARLTSLESVKVKDGDREIAVTDISSLNNEVVTGVITLAEPLDLSKSYTVEIEGYEPKTAVPTDVFDSEDFVSAYYYDGDDLGAVINGDKTVFKVWAPTASQVELCLYEAGDGGGKPRVMPMEKGDKGVWSLEVGCGHGQYYTYSVTTAEGTKEAVDPYARAAGVNGDRGMVVDLERTDPEGFEDDDRYTSCSLYNYAVIWEVHVRDFSNNIEGSQYKGKYLAFTETGLTNSSGQPVGVDYLKDLGVTHVHLQPVYDFATVDESSEDPQFNWGYDPKNYNVPEGSYSTDPYHGEVRINEFKQMVKAIHESGMGVVMDVVYNHTYDADSNLNRIVPNYYYRYSGGKLSNGSGCGNETASDRAMYRKYMVDSVKYWAEEYHVDGFRFDLMALHDIETMQQIEETLHGITSGILIYGEGWTGGTTPLPASKQANQANISKVVPTGIASCGIAVFNDVIRDGLKGSVFDAMDTGYINGNANAATAQKVIFGLTGGQKSPAASWSVENNCVINYMSCHDNNTLWDKLLKANADASDEERMLMNRLGAEIIMIGRGVPFFLAGEEMLRTKGGDANSYKSPDSVNNIDWEALKPGSDVMRMRDLYRSLITMRWRYGDPFLSCDMECTVLEGGAIEITWYYHETELVIAKGYVNPFAEDIEVELPEDRWPYGEDAETKPPEGGWRVILRGWDVYEEPAEQVGGRQTVEGRSVLIVVTGLIGMEAPEVGR